MIKSDRGPKRPPYRIVPEDPGDGELVVDDDTLLGISFHPRTRKHNALLLEREDGNGYYLVVGFGSEEVELYAARDMVPTVVETISQYRTRIARSPVDALKPAGYRIRKGAAGPPPKW